MQSRIRAALVATLSGKFSLSKSRLETLVCLLIAMVSSRTVNLTHAACHLPDEALHASRCRRLQRFFQHVRLDQDAAARLAIGMLNLTRPVPLALDRTNWRIGSKNIDILSRHSWLRQRMPAYVFFWSRTINVRFGSFAEQVF